LTRGLLSLSTVYLFSGCMIAPFMSNNIAMQMDTNSSKTKKQSHSSSGMMMRMDHSQKDMEHVSNHGEMPSHSKSYVIAQRYCTQCHEMKEAVLYSNEEWRPILKRMIGYMKKTGNLQPDVYDRTLLW